MGAEAIVPTLKAKIKANDEELQMFQDKCEDTRTQLNTEIKEREESEAEVNNCTRKLKMIEEKIEKNDERFESISSKLQSASDSCARGKTTASANESTYRNAQSESEDCW